jgi:hypothetical protein
VVSITSVVLAPGLLSPSSEASRIVRLAFCLEGVKMTTATTTRVNGHLSEMVMVDDRIAVGCACGWTCRGGFDDQITAYAAIATHFLACQ